MTNNFTLRYVNSANKSFEACVPKIPRNVKSRGDGYRPTHKCRNESFYKLVPTYVRVYVNEDRRR